MGGVCCIEYEVVQQTDIDLKHSATLLKNRLTKPRLLSVMNYEDDAFFKQALGKHK